jgi:hypothetical protein
MTPQRTQGFVVYLVGLHDPGERTVIGALSWLEQVEHVKAVLIRMKRYLVWSTSRQNFQLTILIRAKNTVRASTVDRMSDRIAASLPTFRLADTTISSSQRRLAHDMAISTDAVWKAGFPSIDVALTRITPPRGGDRSSTFAAAVASGSVFAAASGSATGPFVDDESDDEESEDSADDEPDPAPTALWINRVRAYDVPRMRADWAAVFPPPDRLTAPDIISATIIWGPQPKRLTEPDMDRLARDVSGRTTLAARKRALHEWEQLACRPHVWPAIVWILSRNEFRHRDTRFPASVDDLLAMFKRDIDDVGLVWPSTLGMPLGFAGL